MDANKKEAASDRTRSFFYKVFVPFFCLFLFFFFDRTETDDKNRSYNMMLNFIYLFSAISHLMPQAERLNLFGRLSAGQGSTLTTVRGCECVCGEKCVGIIRNT